MKQFEEAELEVILFEDDIITDSKQCYGDHCMCDGQQYCAKVS